MSIEEQLKEAQDKIAELEATNTTLVEEKEALETKNTTLQKDVDDKSKALQDRAEEFKNMRNLTKEEREKMLAEADEITRDLATKLEEATAREQKRLEEHRDNLIDRIAGKDEAKREALKANYERLQGEGLSTLGEIESTIGDAAKLAGITIMSGDAVVGIHNDNLGNPQPKVPANDYTETEAGKELLGILSPETLSAIEADKK